MKMLLRLNVVSCATEIIKEGGEKVRFSLRGIQTKCSDFSKEVEVG